VGRSPSRVTRMLIRLNSIMRAFKAKHNYPMLFVVDRIVNREDVVVLIVDIFYDDKNQAEEVAKKVIEHLHSYNVKVLDYTLGSYMVPFKEVWRLVAKVAVDIQ
jgi:proteasome assembly chaperone (PAC2) family protein